MSTHTHTHALDQYQHACTHFHFSITKALFIMSTHATLTDTTTNTHNTMWSLRSVQALYHANTLYSRACDENGEYHLVLAFLHGLWALLAHLYFCPCPCLCPCLCLLHHYWVSLLRTRYKYHTPKEGREEWRSG